MSGPGKTQAQQAREQRLAAALRENLKRRKAQARSRGDQPGSAEGGPVAAGGPESHDSAEIVDENESG